MIITNIIGGLGNQMFQYACGRSLSLGTGQPFRLATDQFRGYALHNGFELQRVFNMRAPLATEAEIKQLLGWQATPALRRLFGRPAMRWLTGNRWGNEPHFQYWPGLAELRGPLYLHGYWQTERYFQEHADQIRADFVFQMKWDAQDEAVRQRMRAQPCASLHVRRGDYTSAKSQGVYALCGLDYYREAILLLRERVPDLRLFAFSDDPDWVEAHLSTEFGPLEIVRHNSGARSANDMRLMSQADHHIIANSSFSWWAAWLNPSQDKIVVAPRCWFLNGTNDIDMIPNAWIRI
ncbi:MAG TPA: alpha-1,2-fucosyltransferase [Gallionellaceae bacterium]